MSHHETPQSERGYKELKILHSPLTPPISYSPYLSPPLATSTKNESKAEAERKDPTAR
jgi:hypothetical protein